MFANGLNKERSEEESSQRLEVCDMRQRGSFTKMRKDGGEGSQGRMSRFMG